MNLQQNLNLQDIFSKQHTLDDIIIIKILNFKLYIV